MDKSVAWGSSRVKLLTVLTVFAMAFAALAYCPVDTSDAEDGVKVSTWDELKDAVKSASWADSIILANDIIDNSDDGAIEIKENKIYLDLAGFKIDRQRGTADGKDGRLFKISEGSLVVKNGTLTGGHGDDGGCVLLKDGSDISLENVNVTNHYSDDDGGAIWAADSQIIINGGNFTNNVADDNGGAIYAEGESSVTIDGAKFSDNYSDDDGSAVYSNNSYYLITGCDISNNHAGGNGGAVYADKEAGEKYIYRPLIKKTSFTGNHADDNGGAIYLNNTKSGIETCTFDGNYCATDGGAIYSDDSDFMISSSEFKNNNAPDSGGALMLYGGEYDIRHTVYENNHANSCGGGVYINNDSVVTLADVTFKGNNVLMDGGGLLIGGDDNKVSLEDRIIITGNTAERNGPNVFIRSDLKLICDLFEEGNSIGVVLEEGDRKFTEGFGENNPRVDPTKIFFSDDPDYYVGNSDGEAKMYKSGSGGDMSDNTVWIIVGVIAAIVVVAVVAIHILRTRKSNSV